MTQFKYKIALNLVKGILAPKVIDTCLGSVIALIVLDATDISKVDWKFRYSKPKYVRSSEYYSLIALIEIIKLPILSQLNVPSHQYKYNYSYRIAILHSVIKHYRYC